ncbi:DUF4232 domain-containing protein [Amnibacterium kyonggiense]
MIRRPAPGVLVPLLTAGLLALGLVSPGASADAAGMPDCRASQLRAELTGFSSDDTDEYSTAVFTDTGAACRLRGRPAVALADRSGRRIGRAGQYFAYSPDGGRPRTGAVELRTRRAASVWLALAVASGSRCPVRPVGGFLVRLPHESVRLVRVPRAEQRRFTVCASRTANELDYSQVLSGRR